MPSSPPTPPPPAAHGLGRELDDDELFGPSPSPPSPSPSPPPPPPPPPPRRQQYARRPRAMPSLPLLPLSQPAPAATARRPSATPTSTPSPSSRRRAATPTRVAVQRTVIPPSAPPRGAQPRAPNSRRIRATASTATAFASSSSSAKHFAASAASASASALSRASLLSQTRPLRPQQQPPAGNSDSRSHGARNAPALTPLSTGSRHVEPPRVAAAAPRRRPRAPSPPQLLQQRRRSGAEAAAVSTGAVSTTLKRPRFSERKESPTSGVHFVDDDDDDDDIDIDVVKPVRKATAAVEQQQQQEGREPWRRRRARAAAALRPGRTVATAGANASDGYDAPPALLPCGAPRLSALCVPAARVHLSRGRCVGSGHAADDLSGLADGHVWRLTAHRDAVPATLARLEERNPARFAVLDAAWALVAQRKYGLAELPPGVAWWREACAIKEREAQMALERASQTLRRSYDEAGKNKGERTTRTLSNRSVNRLMRSRGGAGGGRRRLGQVGGSAAVAPLSKIDKLRMQGFKDRRRRR